MVQKIMLALEINDDALDAAQAKADKLVETLREAERLMAKLDKREAPQTNNDWGKNFRPDEITCSPKMSLL